MNEHDAIAFLVENNHQITMDACEWIYRLGPLAGDMCGKYTVYTDVDGKPTNEKIFDSIDEAVDAYLKLAKTVNV